MNIQCTTIRNVLLIAGTATVISCVVPAYANDLTLPQAVHEGNITYISGGIGQDEEQALQAEAKNYDLLMTNANKRGDFTADTDLVITGKNGHEIIKVNNTGPMFYARLPSGTYKIEATNGNQHEVRNIKISTNRPTDLHLIWRQS